MIKKILTILLLISIIGLCIFFRVQYDKASEQLNYAEKKIATVEKQLDESNKELNKSDEELKEYKNKLDIANKTIKDLKSDEYELIYMGEYKISYYCNEKYSHICGGGTGKTASGKPTEVGVTAAADWNVLPKGSKIYIQDIGFREVQDRGSAVNGNHIDVLVNTHDEANSNGLDHEGVWLLIKK